MERKAEGSDGPDKGAMQVITRAATVLGALAAPGGGRSLAQLAKQTGLPKTTVHRICTALESVGYVQVDPASGRRELGSGILRLAVMSRRDLRTVLEPYLARVSRDLNETVDLAVLDGGAGFDWGRKWFRRVAANECGGRGLAILQAYATQVRFNRSGNGVVIIRRLSEEQ